PPDDPLPEGRRVDTRKHTRHVLRPTPAMVAAVLEGDDPHRFEHFRADYRALLDRRFAEDRAPFDALADLARREPVFLGCSCPTKKQPEVRRCHTVEALRFMKARYPDLDVRFPS
ncbi:MAG TPA: hypothetical protein RMH99_24415, partial [Sandaracinaceae bacterium LLY-WYZ-13_1]|nr:hypothetical protein [Sandaracinaceae bacterium LLY-WYZ-13_1]